MPLSSSDRSQLGTYAQQTHEYFLGSSARAGFIARINDGELTEAINTVVARCDALYNGADPVPPVE